MNQMTVSGMRPSLTYNVRNVYDLNMEKYIPEDPYCVMLDVETPLAYQPFMDMPIFQNAAVDDGIVEDHHVTLRYGILPTVDVDDIGAILSAYLFTDLIPVGNTFEVFGRDNDAVVLPVKMPHNTLMMLNQELGCLPNINTFPIYRPHITIGYFKKGFWGTVPPNLIPPIKEFGVKPGKFRITGGGQGNARVV